MEKTFGNLKMGWLQVILFAIITGLYTGFIMLVPFLKETSFQDIGISYEWWVLFAVIVVVNCNKSWEAMLKCFVFFLISQPLIYIVEIIFGKLSFDLAWLYYRQMWLPMTFLTLPGGFIAYFCKKQNIFGSIILGIGNTILMLMGILYFITAFTNFPYHILSALFSFICIFIMTFYIQSQKKNQIISIITPIILTIILIVIIKINGLYIASDIF